MNTMNLFLFHLGLPATPVSGLPPTPFFNGFVLHNESYIQQSIWILFAIQSEVILQRSIYTWCISLSSVFRIILYVLFLLDGYFKVSPSVISAVCAYSSDTEGLVFLFYLLP